MDKIRIYRVIHNSLAYFIQVVHLNVGKDCNMKATDGQRNSPAPLISATWQTSGR